MLGDVDQQNGSADAADELGDAWGVAAAQRGESHPLHDDANHTCAKHGDGNRQPDGQTEPCDRQQPDECAPHENRAVRQIEHAQHAEHERVAQGEQAVDAAEPDGVDDLLGDVHGLTLKLPSHLTQFRSCVTALNIRSSAVQNSHCKRSATARYRES